MRAVLAAGILPLAWIAGYAALRFTTRRRAAASTLELHVLAIGVGIALLTPLLVAIALAGRFQVTWLGGAGWVGLLAASAVIFRRRARLLRLDRYEVAAVAIAVVFVLVGYPGRQSALGAGRDQQVYAEYAMSLARFGHASPRFANLDASDRELVAAALAARLVRSDAFRDDMPGTQPSAPVADASLSAYLPPGWTVWLAFAPAIGGPALLHGANAFVMAFAALLVFALARRATNGVLALAACALFCTLPLSLWIAGIALSEPLALALLLVLPLLIRVTGARSFALVPVVLFAACCVRADAMLAVPLLLAALALDRALRPAHERVRRRRTLAIAAMATLAVAIVFYAAMLPRQYFADIARFLAPLCHAALVLGVVALLPAAWLRRAGAAIAARPASLIATAIVVGLFLYAALVRPSAEPYALLPYAGGLTGTRDYREDALRNLAAYVGWPLLAVSVAGLCLALREAMRPTTPFGMRLFTVLSLGFALLYLWYPHVSPDHPWAARRYVPVILPAVVLFAAFAVHRSLRRRAARALPLGGLVLACASGPAWALQGTVALGIAHRSDDAQLAGIAAALPDALIVADARLANLATALFVAYGKPVLVLRFDDGDDRASIERWLVAKHQAGKPAWLLQDPATSRAGARADAVSTWSVERTVISPENRAPATRIARETVRLALLRVIGIDRSAVARLFGGDLTWGVRDDGFLPAQDAPFGRFRYTLGGAWLDVPSDAWAGARALKVDLFAHATASETRWARVLVDRQAIWEGYLRGGVSTVVAPLPPGVPGPGRNVVIELWSGTERLPTTGPDPRSLIGVGLIGLRPLHADEPVASGPSMTGFRSRLAPVARASDIGGDGTGLPFADLDIANAGTVAWPSIAATGQVHGAVQIGLRWYPAGQPQTLVGDNRWAMSLSLLPGDSLRMRVPLVPTGLKGKRLPAGDYEVRIGMVREGYAWFADGGDEPIRMPVTIAR